MSLLRRKIWWRAIIGSRVTLAILLLLCTALAFSVYDRYTIEREMAKRRADTEAELQALKERQSTLQEKVEYLNDKRGIEAEIRQHFDVAREGEQVIILVDKDRDEEKASVPIEDSEEDKNFWSWLPW